VCDPDGRIVSRRPITIRREVDRGGPYRALAVDADLPLTQAGEFLIRLTLLDEVARKESTLTLPLTVSRP
jgi:hypothetical protein